MSVGILILLLGVFIISDSGKSRKANTPVTSGSTHTLDDQPFKQRLDSLNQAYDRLENIQLAKRDIIRRQKILLKEQEDAIRMAADGRISWTEARRISDRTVKDMAELLKENALIK